MGPDPQSLAKLQLLIPCPQVLVLASQWNTKKSTPGVGRILRLQPWQGPHRTQHVPGRAQTRLSCNSQKLQSPINPVPRNCQCFAQAGTLHIVQMFGEFNPTGNTCSKDRYLLHVGEKDSKGATHGNQTAQFSWSPCVRITFSSAARRGPTCNAAEKPCT